MRALKTLVVVMGIMLVVGFAALVAVIAGRVSRGGSSGDAAGRSFPATAIEIPRGARIEAMTTAPNRLILDLVLADGGRQLVFLDMNSGARLGTIELHQAR